METEKIVKIDSDYLDWVNKLIKHYRQCQVKAAISVNSAILKFYWIVGHDISVRSLENRYGAHFYEKLSLDLRKSLDLKKGLSSTTLKYAKYFYELYSPLFPSIKHDLIDNQMNQNRQQPADDFEMIFSIPWSHQQTIIDKVGGNAKKALFFVRKSLENNWGRSVLLNFLSTDLFETQGKAQTNFSNTLPSHQGDLAQQILKSPYHFEFLQMEEKYTEKQLKDELIQNMIKLMLELGRGFAFVGKEYHLKAGGKDKYIDLLFYIIPLHSYCVVEVKTTEFDFPDIGQLAGYVAMVDDLLNTPNDNPAIGLLICKEKNSVLAKYALSKINSPIGISEYDTKKEVPKKVLDMLPSPEQIAKALMDNH